MEYEFSQNYSEILAQMKVQKDAMEQKIRTAYSADLARIQVKYTQLRANVWKIIKTSKQYNIEIEYINKQEKAERLKLDENLAYVLGLIEQEFKKKSGELFVRYNLECQAAKITDEEANRVATQGEKSLVRGKRMTDAEIQRELDERERQWRNRKSETT